jgi:hypothetical protein
MRIRLGIMIFWGAAAAAGVFWSPVAVRAQGAPDELIIEFKEANRSGDQPRRRAAYDALKTAPAAVAELKIREPRYYQLYEALALAEKAELMEARRLNHGFVVEGGRATPGTIRGRSNNNRGVVRAAPNRERRPNSEVVRSYPNQLRYKSLNNTPNSQRVRQNANQDQPVNNTRRVRSYR